MSIQKKKFQGNCLKLGHDLFLQHYFISFSIQSLDFVWHGILMSLNKLQIIIYNTLRRCESCHACNAHVKSFAAGIAARNRLFRLQDTVGRIWLSIKCNPDWCWPTVDLFNSSCSAVNCVFNSNLILYSGTYLQRNRKGPFFFIFTAGRFRLHWYLKFGLYELYNFPAKDNFPVCPVSV